MAKIKKNKNTINKNDPNQKNKAKQIKPRESAYCETQCKEFGNCEKYKNYIERLNILHKVGHGIMCSK